MIKCNLTNFEETSFLFLITQARLLLHLIRLVTSSYYHYHSLSFFPSFKEEINKRLERIVNEWKLLNDGEINKRIESFLDWIEDKKN